MDRPLCPICKVKHWPAEHHVWPKKPASKTIKNPVAGSRMVDTDPPTPNKAREKAGFKRTPGPQAGPTKTDYVARGIPHPAPGEVCPLCGHRRAMTASQRSRNSRERKKDE